MSCCLPAPALNEQGRREHAHHRTGYPPCISTFRDRVCMMAAMLVLEPIFEADLPSELYAYRPAKRSAGGGRGGGAAVSWPSGRGGHRTRGLLREHSHADLLNSIGPRIVDRRVLHLIRIWLDCPVEETDNRGRKTRTTEARDKRRGTPQGSADLPLAGEYLHAPVRAGMEDVRVRVNLGHAARDLRRPRDPV